jgi:hypothetical protein
MQSLLLLSLAGAALPAAKKHAGTPLFAAFSPVRPNRWRFFFVSVALHVAGLLLLPPVTSQLWEPSDRELWIRQQRIYRSLRIRIPENLYVASSGVTAPVPERKPHYPPPKTPPPGASRAERAAEQGGHTGRPRRKFKLPELARRQTPDTILQPQFAPDMKPESVLQLPEVFFWAPQKQQLRELKPFVTPGNAPEPGRPRLLDARPKLEVPYEEASALPLPETTPSNLLLSSPTGPALPIQVTEPEGGIPKTGVSAEAGPGDPATLLSLVLDPQRLREFLSVPPGNQLGRQMESGKTGAITGAEAGSGQGRGRGSGNGDDAGGGRGAATEGSGTGTARDLALSAAAATRVVHPAGGVFDVVVETSSLNGFPESAGVLSGKPIYSVYVAAGAARDWILQYCIPAEDDTSVMVAGPVVRLGAPAILTAPYPRITMRPALHLKPGQYVMVHGMVSPAGRFDALRVLGRTEPQDAAATLAVLEQWEFRPAARNGEAVRVEVLLAIPAE